MADDRVDVENGDLAGEMSSGAHQEVLGTVKSITGRTAKHRRERSRLERSGDYMLGKTCPAGSGTVPKWNESVARF